MINQSPEFDEKRWISMYDEVSGGIIFMLVPVAGTHCNWLVGGDS